MILWTRPFTDDARSPHPALPTAVVSEDARLVRTEFPRHLLWNLLAEALARGASLWLVFFCGRVLSVSSFGVLVLSLSVVQWTWLLADAVLNAGYASRELARLRDGSSGLGGLFLRIRIAAALILSVLFLIVVSLVPGAREYRSTLMAGSVFFLGYALFPDWAARGNSDYRSLAIANIIWASVAVVLTWTMLGMRAEPAPAIFAWGSSFVVAGLALIAVLWRKGDLTLHGPGSIALWRSHAHRSAVFSLGAMCAAGIIHLAPIQLAAFGTTEEVGFFAAGFRLLLALFGAIAIAWWPLLSIMARIDHSSPEFRAVVGWSTGWLFALIWPATLLLTAFPDVVLRTVFGPAYVGGAAYLGAAAWVLPLFALSGLLEYVCLATGLEAARVRAYGLALGAVVPLGVAGVPVYGPLASAATLVVAYAIAVVSFLRATRQLLSWRPIARQLRGLLIAGLFLSMAWGFAAHGPDNLRLFSFIAGGALYPALAFRHLARSPRDLQR